MATKNKNNVAVEKETAPDAKIVVEDTIKATTVEEKTTPVKKATKPAAKSTAKAPKKAPAKKQPAVKALTLDAVVKAAKKKMKTADTSKISRPIAVNVEVYGECFGTFYILINDGKIAVEPYKYDDGDVWVKADAKAIMSVFAGEAKIYDELSSGSINIYDNVKKAILFVDAIR